MVKILWVSNNLCYIKNQKIPLYFYALRVKIDNVVSYYLCFRYSITRPNTITINPMSKVNFIKSLQADDTTNHVSIHDHKFYCTTACIREDRFHCGNHWISDPYNSISEIKKVYIKLCLVCT